MEQQQINKTKVFKQPWFKSVMGALIVFLILGGFIYWYTMAGQTKTDNALVVAPIINLSPLSLGTLEEVYVKVGDKVEPYTPIAKVGNEIITSKVAGIISSISDTEGQVFAPGTTVVQMINLDKERVIGQVDEDKGLSNIKTGNLVTFTVDTFGSKKYVGIVEEVAPSAHQGDIVFNISDKRQVQQFDVKVKFDINKYPELKNGMSAKLVIFN